MLLSPLSNAFASLAYAPIPRGCIELPTAYGEHVWGLMKGRPTKYVKRVPKPGGGYRYFYDVGHGGGVHAQEHMVEGARFRHGEGHFHVVKSEGDTLHVRNSATGEEHTITKQALSKKLAEHHAEGIKAYRDRASKALAEAKANKASPKQIARLEERVKRAGGSKSAEPAPKETPKPTGKPPSATSMGKQEFIDAKSQELRKKQADVLAGIERSIADAHPGPYKYGMTPVQSLQFEKNVTPSQQKLLTDWRQAKKAASEDITMARSTFGHAWDQHNKPKDKTAEYEANASFLERLADAKDKDAGKEAPKPAPEPKPSAEQRAAEHDKQKAHHSEMARDIEKKIGIHASASSPGYQAKKAHEDAADAHGAASKHLRHPSMVQSVADRLSRSADESSKKANESKFVQQVKDPVTLAAEPHDPDVERRFWREYDRRPGK